MEMTEVQRDWRCFEEAKLTTTVMGSWKGRFTSGVMGRREWGGKGSVLLTGVENACVTGHVEVCSPAGAEVGLGTGRAAGRGASPAQASVRPQVSFQHEVYPAEPAAAPTGPTGAGRELEEQPLSRQVFIVQELEVRDRLASSQINKFLYLHTSERMPRRAHANMVRPPPPPRQG